MPTEALAVIERRERWAVLEGDCLPFMQSLPDDTFDLILTSPPYENRRRYGRLNFRLKGQAFVDWLAPICAEMCRVCRGPVVVNIQGTTDDYRWSATPFFLGVRLIEMGFNLRCPCLYHRVGMPGSGAKDYLRCDYEFCLVMQKRNRKFPYGNNTATGHPPKYAPGGACSHRTRGGARKNQWGGSPNSGRQRREHGQRQKGGRPSHIYVAANEGGEYKPPVLANPGDVFKETYTAGEVAAILEEFGCGVSNVLHCNVGGGHMGAACATDNEAPFAEKFVAPVILTWCPPDGLVYDPFGGGGTTVAVAVELGRRGIMTDLRGPTTEDPEHDMVSLARRRIGNVVPLLLPPEAVQTVPFSEHAETAAQLARPFREAARRVTAAREQSTLFDEEAANG